MRSYLVEYQKNGVWNPGSVVSMQPSHLSRYLAILATRNVPTRLKATTMSATYHFNGEQLKSLV